MQGAEKPVRPQPLTAGPLPSVRESHVQSLLPRSRPDTVGPADVAPNSVLVAESTKLLLLCVSVRCAMFPTTLDRGAGHRLSRAPSTCPGQWVRRWHQGPWRPLGRGGWQAAEGFGLGCPAALSCQPTAPPGRPGWVALQSCGFVRCAELTSPCRRASGPPGLLPRLLVLQLHLSLSLTRTSPLSTVAVGSPCA